jgi:hypothetical protein
MNMIRLIVYPLAQLRQEVERATKVGALNASSFNIKSKTLDLQASCGFRY